MCLPTVISPVQSAGDGCYEPLAALPLSGVSLLITQLLLSLRQGSQKGSGHPTLHPQQTKGLSLYTLLHCPNLLKLVVLAMSSFKHVMWKATAFSFEILLSKQKLRAQ